MNEISSPERGIEAEVAVMGGRKFVGQAQTETGTRHVFASRLIDPIKTVEYPLPILVRDRRAGVGNGQKRFPVADRQAETDETVFPIEEAKEGHILKIQNPGYLRTVVTCPI